jgi:hypothetical protein
MASRLLLWEESLSANPRNRVWRLMKRQPEESLAGACRAPGDES